MFIMVAGKVYDSDETPIFYHVSLDEIKDIRVGTGVFAPKFPQEGVILKSLQVFDDIIKES